MGSEIFLVATGAFMPVAGAVGHPVCPVTMGMLGTATAIICPQHNILSQAIIVVCGIRDKLPIIRSALRNRCVICQDSVSVQPLEGSGRPIRWCSHLHIRKRPARTGNRCKGRRPPKYCHSNVCGHALLRHIVITIIAYNLVKNSIYARVCCLGNGGAVRTFLGQLVLHFTAGGTACVDELLRLTVVGQSILCRWRSVGRIRFPGGSVGNII